jgi:hypothetical protein
MILFGVVWLIVASRLPDREPVRVYDDNGNEPPAGNEFV